MTSTNPASKWGQFMKDLHYALSNRLLQKQKSQFATQTKNLLDVTSSIPNHGLDEVSTALQNFLDLFAANFSRRNLKYENIQEINLDDDKLRDLNTLVRETLDTEPNFEVKDTKLRVKGQIISLSSVKEYLDKRPALKVVEIFALDKVFIDEDFDASGQEIQLTIVAPVWEVEKNVTINLSGKDGQSYGEDAGSLDTPGSPGNDGKPGKPGGNAGTFLGVGKRCIRCSDLKINANGGKGGRGQDGGAGKNGKDGKKPKTKVSLFSCNEYLTKWKEDGMDPEPCGASYYEQSSWSNRQNCEVHGGGRAGGDGGNGGRAGIGGKPGSASVLIRSDGAAIIESKEGPGGQPGSGGKGGEGGKKPVLKVTLSTTFESYSNQWQCTEYYNKETVELYPPGEPGKSGVQNDDSTSTKIQYLTNPSIVLNDYKSYLRGNLKTPVIGAASQRFLNYLETDKNVTGLYDTLGLVKDLLNLENQSRDLLEQGISLVPFYQQLLDRIDSYELQQHEKQDAEEYKLVLSYLYRSALSKIQSINSNANNNLVVDVSKNLEYVLKNIEEWQNFKDLADKNKTRENYKKGLQRKIEEANAFIDNEIAKDIEDNIENTTKQLNKLYAEVVEQEKTKEKEEHALEQQREKLQRQMALRAVLGVVQIASQALTFAGPVGAAAGAAIGGVTSVVDSFATSDTTTVAITALPTAVTNTLNKLNEAYKKKHETFKQQLNKANTKMEEFLNDKNVKAEASQAYEKVKEIQKEMTSAKTRLDELIKGATIEDPGSVNEMYDLRKKIDDLLKDGKEQVGKLGGADKYKNALEKTQNIIGLAKMGVDLYSKVQGDFDKITAVDKSIAAVNDQLSKLDKFEQTIYTTLAPLIDRINESIAKAEGSEGKTHAALDVAKWQVQGAIRDIRRELQQQTTGYKAGDEITYYIDKVEYGLSMMIQMYDRIQSYTEQGELADVDSSADLSNQDLYTAVTELKLKISTNIISEFDSSMKAVLLHVFPFASDYMKPLAQPEKLKLNSAEQLVDNLKSVQKALQREESTIQSRDSRIISNVTFAEGGTLPPFFIWKSGENRDSIDKLLRGEPIELKADISTGLKENAIKFNDIAIRFKVQDSGLQAELNQRLSKYALEMVHLGNSQFRCGDGIYIVPHEKQTIRRSVINEEGLGNGVFAKIHGNSPVLSPFAGWEISLKNINGEDAPLNEFIGQEIDLVMEGHGSFVLQGEPACNDDLKNYYNTAEGRLFNEDDYEDQEELYSLRPVEYSAATSSNEVQYLEPANNLEWITGVQQITEARGEPATGNNVNLYSAGVPATLPLFELMMRKINGSKRQKRSTISHQADDINKEFAQNLAYSAYAPK